MMNNGVGIQISVSSSSTFWKLKKGELGLISFQFQSLSFPICNIQELDWNRITTKSLNSVHVWDSRKKLVYALFLYGPFLCCVTIFDTAIY